MRKEDKRKLQTNKSETSTFGWTFHAQGKSLACMVWSPHPLSTQFPWSPVQWHPSQSFFDCLPDDSSRPQSMLTCELGRRKVWWSTLQPTELSLWVNVTASPPQGGVTWSMVYTISHRSPSGLEPHVSSRVFWPLTQLVLASFSVRPHLPMPPSHWGSWGTSYIPSLHPNP